MVISMAHVNITTFSKYSIAEPCSIPRFLSIFEHIFIFSVPILKTKKFKYTQQHNNLYVPSYNNHDLLAILTLSMFYFELHFFFVLFWVGGDKFQTYDCPSFANF